MAAKNGGTQRPTFTDQEALLFHSQGRPGKLEIVATKPMATQRDLSLAYSPGVAVPVLAIAEDESKAYDYTTKGNFVAVITNGTAILGLGNRGALAAKPVMEGKAVLFKRFADIDSIDLEVSSEDPDEVINCVRYLGKGWGGINQWKSAHAVETKARTLQEAFEGADVAFGLSQKGAFTIDMVKAMAPRPIIFAMANPDPEITVEEVAQVRSDAIMATGRSDYPNQVNNVLGFPFIFRGALDVRATTINMEMKIAAAHALAELAREDVPDEVAAAYGTRPKFGPDYIIPVPFDPRLISSIPPAVAKAAMDTGVARKPIADMDSYRETLRSRRDPVAGALQRVYERLRRRPQRVVFAEGEEEQVIRAAASFVQQGLGSALLVGREDRVRASAAGLGVELGGGIEIINAALSQRNTIYANYLYERLQRKGYLQRDCHRLVNQDRNHFASCMVALGDADAMVTGVTRNFSVALADVRRCVDPKRGPPAMG